MDLVITMNVFDVATIVLIILKVLGLTEISWWLVVLPAMIPLIFVLLVSILEIVIELFE